MGAMSRRLRALERRVGGSREFRAGAPPVDEDGLPDWTADGLSLDAYSRLLGDSPDADLTPAELETRRRLAPFAEVFERLEKDENEEETVR